MLKKILLIGLVTTSVFAEVGTLTKIKDGDTVDFGNTICRFANIDTPESKPNPRLNMFLEKSCRGVTARFILKAGEESAEKLNELLKVGRQYKYEIIGNDNKKRKICNIYLNERDTVNLEMVKSGYALPFYQYMNNEAKGQYTKASKEAKEKQRGLYVNYQPVMKCMSQELDKYK